MKAAIYDVLSVVRPAAIAASTEDFCSGVGPVVPVSVIPGKDPQNAIRVHSQL